MSTPPDASYKKAQHQPLYGQQMEPTLQSRINRLNPGERHEVRAIINRLKLRKIIRKTLAEAFWRGPPTHIKESLRRSAASTTSTQTYKPVTTTSDTNRKYED